MDENFKKRIKRSSKHRNTKSSSSGKNIVLELGLEKSNFHQFFTYLSCLASKGKRLKFPMVFFPQNIHLVSSKLFRPLPAHSSPAAIDIQFGESFYIKKYKAKNNNTFQDPAWPDLKSVYWFLVSILKSAPQNHPHQVQPSFILNLLDLFQFEDPRERDALVSVFQLLYKKFELHRNFIRRSVFNIFYCCVVDDNEKLHNGIPELLLFLKSVVVIEKSSGDLGVQEVLKMFLVRGLIPLYKSKWLVLFLSQLNSCIETFLQTDCGLAETVVQGMLRHWPVAGSSREYFFLDGVERVLGETTKPDVFQHFMIPLFRRIAGCWSSLHNMVAEKALSLFEIQGNIQKLIKQNLDVILLIIFTDLETNARNHWQPEIQKLAYDVGNSLLNMNSQLFESCLLHMMITSTLLDSTSVQSRNLQKVTKVGPEGS